MRMMDLLLGRRQSSGAKPRHSKPAPSTQFESQQTQAGSSANSVRKDLLKLVLRETLTRNGIPPSWLSADMLRTNSTKREPGLHVRFLVRHWDPRLLEHGVALEQEFTHRLMLLDPMAGRWLNGFSWQFALDDTSLCPALPQPSAWTAPPPVEAAPRPCAKPSSYGDIIEGPALDARPLEEVRADLERLLAVRDDDMRRHHPAGSEQRAYAPTRPATL